jgi:hypothetical protein
VQWPPREWRSAKSAPPRQASTQLPESPSSRPRVRAIQTGGGPLRPAGYRAHLNRRTNPGPSLTLGDPGGGSARPLRYAPACGSGRCAPCGRVRDGPALAVSARSPSLRSGGKSARGHPVPSENAYTDGTADSSSSYRLTLSAVPTVPAGALLSPRQTLRYRCASCGPSLPYDSGDSVTLLRRYTAPPSRRSPEARLAPGLAPGASHDQALFCVSVEWAATKG